jgi:hypothetical protein
MTTETMGSIVGRELDALVAERVMGYRWRRFEYPPVGVSFKYGRAWTWLSREGAGFDVEGGETRYIENVPHYSFDIAAAWSVLEKLRLDGWDLTFGSNARDGWWIVATTGRRPDRDDVVEAAAEMFALTVCRAALIAVGAA